MISKEEILIKSFSNRRERLSGPYGAFSLARVGVMTRDRLVAPRDVGFPLRGPPGCGPSFSVQDPERQSRSKKESEKQIELIFP